MRHNLEMSRILNLGSTHEGRLFETSRRQSVTVVVCDRALKLGAEKL